MGTGCRVQTLSINPKPKCDVFMCGCTLHSTMMHWLYRITSKQEPCPASVGRTACLNAPSATGDNPANDSAEAEAAHDEWAACVLRWLLGEPIPAIRGLLTSSLSSRGSASDAGDTAHSADSHETVQAADTIDPDPLVLDFAWFCIRAFGFSPAQLGLAPQLLCTLALHAACAFDTGGYAVMALEMLHLAAVCKAAQAGQPATLNPKGHSPDAACAAQTTCKAHVEAITQAWMSRVAAGCLVRCFGALGTLSFDPACRTDPGDPSAPSLASCVPPGLLTSIVASSSAATGWRKEAMRQLQSLAKEGVTLNSDLAMVELASLAAALGVNALPAEHAGLAAESASQVHGSLGHPSQLVLPASFTDPQLLSPGPASPSAASETSAAGQPQQGGLVATLSLPSTHSVQSSTQSGQLFQTLPHHVLQVPGDHLTAVCCSNTGAALIS